MSFTNYFSKNKGKFELRFVKSELDLSVYLSICGITPAVTNRLFLYTLCARKQTKGRHLKKNQERPCHVRLRDIAFLHSAVVPSRVRNVLSRIAAAMTTYFFPGTGIVKIDPSVTVRGSPPMQQSTHNNSLIKFTLGFVLILSFNETAI